MKANELINMTPNFWGKGNKAVDLIDLKTARAMVEYASYMWKGCFTEEEKTEYTYDILSDRHVLELYIENLKEDIDNDRQSEDLKNLYNKALELMNR